MIDLTNTFLVKVQYDLTDYDYERKSVETFHLVNATDASAAYDKVDAFYAEKTENAGMYTCYWVNSIEVMENIL